MLRVRMLTVGGVAKLGSRNWVKQEQPRGVKNRLDPI